MKLAQVECSVGRQSTENAREESSSVVLFDIPSLQGYSVNTSFSSYLAHHLLIFMIKNFGVHGGIPLVLQDSII